MHGGVFVNLLFTVAAWLVLSIAQDGGLLNADRNRVFSVQTKGFGKVSRIRDIYPISKYFISIRCSFQLKKARYVWHYFTLAMLPGQTSTRNTVAVREKRNPHGSYT